MAEDSIRAIMYGMVAAVLLCVMGPEARAGGPAGDSQPLAGGLFSLSSDSQREQAIAALPLARLTRDSAKQILDVAQSPTIYRRLPTQAIGCDRDMFLFLVRNPEVLVGMWELMGITNVQTKRTGPYRLAASDGSGTECQIDLVYGDAQTHIFVADGSYDGKLAARPIEGRGVFVLQSSYAQSASGATTVTGVLDCFVKFDSLGADLVARTLSGLIGRSADNNYVETARFVAQISQAAERNPPAMLDVASRLPQATADTRRKFAEAITTVARRADENPRTAQRPEQGISRE